MIKFENYDEPKPFEENSHRREWIPIQKNKDVKNKNQKNTSVYVRCFETTKFFHFFLLL